MFEDEEWRAIEGLPHYFISTHGRVKREDSPSARKVSLNDRGFPIITLYGADGKTRNLRQINVLVAKAFLPPATFDNETAIWHIDGDFTNCRVDNLRWDTRPRVLEWNEMNKSRQPKMSTPMVKNNRTGQTYENAFECALAEGELETTIVWKVEKQARSLEDDNARYRYIFGG